MPAKGRGRHPLRSTWLGRGRGRGRGRGLTSPVGKQILPSGAARVGHEVYSDWFFPETELKLYLRNTTTNGISIGGVACYDLLTTQGSSTDTAVVNTTAAGTEIQFTKTAGGSVAAFITGRVPSGGWTITNSDVALWLQESASTVNAGLRYRLFKYSGGVETELGGSPFTSGTEFSTSSALETLVGNVTDTALAEDDRLLLRIYAVNVGTMAVGTATLNFNGAIGVGGSPSYSLVQTASGVGSTATATATFGSTPTVGNLMVAHYFTRATTATPPAGWTQAVQSFNATENDSVNVYYRIVQSGDGTGYTWGDGTDDELVRITEWSSSTGWPANPVDKTATTGRTTATSSLSSGTTATTTQADELSIAAVGLRNVVANTPNYTNSFTGQTLVTGGTNTSTLFPAYKIESATGAKETTASWSGGAETAIGAIATFMGNAGAAADSFINVYPAVTFKAESSGINVALTGQTETLSSGNLTASANKAIAGNTFTASQGTLAGTVATGITGQNNTSAFGNLNASITNLLSGNFNTANQGVLASVIAALLSGSAQTVSQGTLTPNSTSNIDVALTGQAQTLSAGTLSATNSIALSTNTQTQATGTITSGIDRVLSTSLNVLSSGTLTSTISKALTSVLSTFGIGSVTVNNNVPLNGISSAISTGTLTPSGSVNVQLSGQAQTLSAGNITATFNKAIGGLSSTFGIGNLTSAPSNALSSQVNTQSQGGFIVSVVKALGGQAWSYLQGILTPSITTQVQLTGQQQSISQGQLASAISVALSGVEYSYEQGTLTVFGQVVSQYPLENVVKHYALEGVVKAYPLAGVDYEPLQGINVDYPLAGIERDYP